MLYYIILYHIISYHIMLYYIILYYIILYYIILYCIILYYIILVLVMLHRSFLGSGKWSNLALPDADNKKNSENPLYLSSIHFCILD